MFNGVPREGQRTRGLEERTVLTLESSRLHMSSPQPNV
jgi:hypothetical protein